MRRKLKSQKICAVSNLYKIVISGIWKVVNILFEQNFFILDLLLSFPFFFTTMIVNKYFLV